MSEWDKSLDQLVEEIDKIDKNKKKKPKTQTTPAKLTEIKENQEKTMAQEKDKAIYKKLDEMNKKLSKMLTRDDKSIFKEIIRDTFREMKDQLLEPFTKRLDILESDLHQKNIENDNLKTELNNMKKLIEEKDDETKSIINKKNVELKAVKTEIKTETDKRKESLNEIEQYSRRNNIRISGLRNDKPYVTSQETAWQVVSFLNEKMDLDLSVQQIDIAHRLGPFSRDSNRNVIVKFISRQVKINILSNCSALRNTGVYINEDLTRLNSKVLSSMRLKDPENIERAWSYEGKLFLKRKGEEKHEQTIYKDYDKWLDLDWPKKKTSRWN